MTAHILKSGETLQVECLVPGEERADRGVESLRDLIVEPDRPWFSAAERMYVEGALQGCFGGLSRDCFFVGWIGDQPVGNVHYGTAYSTAETGALGYVITAARHRGKGIAAILVREAMTRFLSTGGVCMHLGTANPAAHRLYAASGFRDYNGHVMRYLDPHQDWERYDDAYFGDAGRACVRSGHWGDLARVTILYVAPQGCFIKDFPERIYSHPAIVHTRCSSILPALMLNATERDGRLWVLENAAQRLVGAATLTRLDQTAQRLNPVLDFLVAPAYAAQAPDLLQTALDALRDTPAEQVRVCLASCDQGKAECVRALGFSLEASLSRHLAAGDSLFDLDIWVRSIR